METKVVNLFKEPYDVYIGRAGKGQSGYYGNPIKLQPNEERGATIEKYKDYFYNRLETDVEFKKNILSLQGKTLGCFCSPKPCHGDVIKEYLDTHSEFVEKHLESIKDKREKALELFNKNHQIENS